jgi:hypothetical protein
MGAIVEKDLHDRVIDQQLTIISKSEIKKLVIKSVGLEKKIKLKSKNTIERYADQCEYDNKKKAHRR